jgi:hypothetical protein
MNANERYNKYMYIFKMMTLFFQLNSLLPTQKHFFSLHPFADICGQHAFDFKESV